MNMDRSTNSVKLLLPNCPLYSVDYNSLLEYLKEVGVHLTSEKFDYPVLNQGLGELIIGQVVSRKLDFPFMISKSSKQIYGSCNGLICLEIDYHKIIMWNPGTRNAKLLPEASHFYDDQCARFYGFGYDSTKKDYKVIRECYKFNLAISDDEAKYEVYTVRTGLWRQYVNQSVHALGQGCLVNESLHWVHHEYDEMGYTIDPNILSFSLEEKFEEVVPFPNLPAGNIYESVEVGAMGGCLCVCFEPVDSNLRIWMMKQYGVKESWSEVIKVPREVLPVDFQLNFRPLCILENGEILLYLQRNVLVLYNPRGNTFGTVVETHEDHLLNTTIYVETLVSPETGSDAGM